MKWTLPNILTLLRLAAAPSVPIIILYFQQPLSYLIALAIFILAGMTDFIDGYLARLWKQETAFGKMMDPIADKAMVIMALMVLLLPFNFHPAIVGPTLIIIFREILVSGLREFLGENAKILSVTRIAKWKTSVQIIAISCLFPSLITQFNDGVFEGHSNLMHFDFSDFLSFLSFGSIILLWIASVLTFLSGFDYLSKTLRFIKNENKYD